MSRCKKNVIYIFGYFLFVCVILVPCKQYFYGLSGYTPLDLVVRPLELGDSKYHFYESYDKKNIVLLPIYIYRKTKYNKFSKWKTPIIEDHRNKIIRFRQTLIDEIAEIGDDGEVFIPADDFIAYLSLKGGRKVSPETAEHEMISRFKDYVDKLDEEKMNEYISKFGNHPPRSVLMWELLQIELISILLIAGFSYILFCLVLRKSNIPRRNETKN